MCLLFSSWGRANIVVLAIDVIQSSKWREPDMFGVGFLMQYLQNQDQNPHIL